MRLLLISVFVFSVCVATYAQDKSLFERLHDRRVARLERLIQSLNNREKSLTGQAAQAVRDQIKKFTDAIQSLRDSFKKEDTSDGRRRRSIQLSTPPTFIARRVATVQQQIETIKDNAKKVKGLQRELMVKQVNLLQAAIDRMLQRPTRLPTKASNPNASNSQLLKS